MHRVPGEAGHGSREGGGGTGTVGGGTAGEDGTDQIRHGHLEPAGELDAHDEAGGRIRLVPRPRRPGPPGCGSVAAHQAGAFEMAQRVGDGRLGQAGTGRKLAATLRGAA